MVGKQRFLLDCILESYQDRSDHSNPNINVNIPYDDDQVEEGEVYAYSGAVLFQDSLLSEY